MVLHKGLNTVVERDTGFPVDTARSQPRRLAAEERSDYKAVEQVGNSLRFISCPCSTSCCCGVFFSLFFLYFLSVVQLASLVASCVDFASIRIFIQTCELDSKVFSVPEKAKRIILMILPVRLLSMSDITLNCKKVQQQWHKDAKMQQYR